MSNKQTDLIDVHSHVGVDLRNLFRLRYPIAQSVRDLVLKAKLNHIDRLVVFPIPMSFYYSPVQTTGNSDWILSGFERFPYEMSNKALLYETDLFGDGMVLPFMAIHPKEKIDEQIAFLEQMALSRRMYGLKLHTITTRTTAADLIGSPFIDFPKKYNFPILIHSSTTPSFTHPKMILCLANHHSDICICIAHFADFDKDILWQVREFPNIFVDTTPFLSLCKFAREGEYNQVSSNLFDTDYTDPIKCLVDLADALPGKIIWGTDEPCTAVCDPTGNPLSSYTYADECEVLSRLVSLGHEGIRDSIAKTNTLRFLYGDSM